MPICDLTPTTDVSAHALYSTDYSTDAGAMPICDLTSTLDAVLWPAYDCVAIAIDNSEYISCAYDGTDRLLCVGAVHHSHHVEKPQVILHIIYFILKSV